MVLLAMGRTRRQGPSLRATRAMGGGGGAGIPALQGTTPERRRARKQSGGARQQRAPTAYDLWASAPPEPRRPLQRWQRDPINAPATPSMLREPHQCTRDHINGHLTTPVAQVSTHHSCHGWVSERHTR